VGTRGISADAEIARELMRRVTEENYIPPPLAGEYAAAILAEYKTAVAK
jgi:hypothetical protein